MDQEWDINFLSRLSVSYQECDGDLVFNDCGSACQSYCGKKSFGCIMVCKPGCECPRGLIRSTRDGTTCIEKEDCQGNK